MLFGRGGGWLAIASGSVGASWVGRRGGTGAIEVEGGVDGEKEMNLC